MRLPRKATTTDRRRHQRVEPAGRPPVRQQVGRPVFFGNNNKVRAMSAESVEPPDHHHYNWVMFYTDTVRFLVTALGFYVDLLTKEAQELGSDPYLKTFLTEETRREFRIGRDLDRAKRTKEWFSEKLASAGDRFDIDISLDHETVRYLKSVGLLYLGLIKNKRNEISLRPNISKNTLAAIDREITAKEEFLTRAGVFAKASVLPLLTEQQSSFSLGQEDTLEPNNESLSKAARPAAVLVDSIEILDEELRGRCLDLFKQFRESGQSERHDTVITEATRILEHRLRLLTRSDASLTATDLVNKAFSGEAPKLRVSEVVPEQKAVHLLFLGTFGFIRNPVHHKLLSDLPSERVLQVLGLIDYLISVLNASTPQIE